MFAIRLGRIRSWWGIHVIWVSIFVGILAIAGEQRGHRIASAIELRSNTPQRSEVDGFVSSDTCLSCHPEAYHSWHRSYHRTMTQLASPDSIVSEFDSQFEYFGKSIRLFRKGAEFWAQIDNEERRVVQTTGSHNYQMYWLESPLGNRLESLPLVYLIEEKKWVQRNDIFMVPPSVAAEPEGARIWNDTCIACHSTHGRPKIDESLEANTKVAELGIACEACHGPAADHVEHYSNPLTRYQDRLNGATNPTIVNPSKLTADKSSQVCGQCHSIFSPHDPAEWNENGMSYRAGDQLETSRHVLRHPARVQQDSNAGLSPNFLDKYFWSDGMVRVSGREYNGLIESACHQQGQLSCLSCHSMHDSDPNDQLTHQVTPDQACLQCHEQIGEDISSHTNHLVDSEGSRCYNCHMPHTTYGLVKAIRSHEIDVPSVRASLTTGRPNACNLCHLDETLDWTNEHLAEWYGTEREKLPAEHKTTSASLQWLLAGDAGQRAIVAWHAGWAPAQSAAGTAWIAPFLAELLDDDYAVVRSLAGMALESLPETEELGYDYTAPSSERRQVAEQVLDRWRQTRAEKQEHGSTVLLRDDGKVDYPRLFKLLHRRDNRPVDLLE